MSGVETWLDQTGNITTPTSKHI